MAARTAGALERLASQTGTPFAHLTAARARTQSELSRRRNMLARVAADDDVTVVLFGSWGRHELTEHSDDDWLELVANMHRDEDAIKPPVDELRALLGVGQRKPGSQPLFGHVAFRADLVSNIGLDGDTNTNLSQRILLLLESEPVLHDGVYRDCWDSALDAYLDGSLRDYRPPRFLLNDIVRYWRTLCVDFVGKERAEPGGKWGMRSAKLRLSRKMLFAGGLLPVLRCGSFTAAEIRPFLRDQLATPVTDRVADAFLSEAMADVGARTLSAYDEWLALLGDRQSRAELESLTRENAKSSSTYRLARRLADDLEQGLLALLFESSLRPVVRDYGIF